MAFEGMTFCITGIFSRNRSELVKLLESHGGTVVRSVTKKVTHLLCSDDSESGTTKYQKALERGLPIHDEEWVDAMIAMHGGDVDAAAGVGGSGGVYSAEPDEASDDGGDGDETGRRVADLEVDCPNSSNPYHQCSLRCRRLAAERARKAYEEVDGDAAPGNGVHTSSLVDPETSATDDSADILGNFSDEVLIAIFSWLCSLEDLQSVGCVCREWRRLASDRELWDHVHIVYTDREPGAYDPREDIKKRISTEAIRRFPRYLRHLDLSNTRLTADLLEALVEACPFMSHINLSDTDVPGAALSAALVAWDRMVSLTANDMGDDQSAHHKNQAAVEVLQVLPPTLRELRMDSVSRAFFIASGDNLAALPDLRVLCMPGGPALRYAFLAHPQLEPADGHLEDDEAAKLIEILEASPRLEHIDLGSRHVTDAVLAALVASCPRVHTLSIGYTRVNDWGILVDHANALPALRTLIVIRCEAFDEKALTALLATHPKVEMVNCSETGVDARTRIKLMKQLRAKHGRRVVLV